MTHPTMENTKTIENISREDLAKTLTDTVYNRGDIKLLFANQDQKKPVTFEIEKLAVQKEGGDMIHFPATEITFTPEKFKKVMKDHFESELKDKNLSKGTYSIKDLQISWRFPNATGGGFKILINENKDFKP